MTEEKKELIEKVAEKFKMLDEDSKSYIAGYMTGKLGNRS